MVVLLCYLAYLQSIYDGVSTVILLHFIYSLVNLNLLRYDYVGIYSKFYFEEH